MTSRIVAFITAAILASSFVAAIAQEARPRRDGASTERRDDVPRRGTREPRDERMDNDRARLHAREAERRAREESSDRSARDPDLPWRDDARDISELRAREESNDRRASARDPDLPWRDDARDISRHAAAGADDYVLEAYPPDIVARLEVRDRLLRRAAREAGVDELEAVVTLGKLWRHSPITVAFLGGDADLHRRIAEAASEWSEHGSVRFDFGHDAARNRYRTWSRQDQQFAADIRISFDDRGYYSLVGMDSRDPAIVRPGDASMNLSGFDTWLPADWHATALHEFGHALGLQHEHQHPEEPCDFRFNDDPGYQPRRDQFGQFIPDGQGRRPGLYTLLGGPPNNWSRAVVDHNLRRLPESRALYDSGPFDSRSIMKYYFPAWMFESGEDSHCTTTTRNDTLSQGDRQSIARAYPADRAARRELEATQEQHEELATDLAALALPQATPGLETVSRSPIERPDPSPAMSLKERLARIRPRTSDLDSLESVGSEEIQATPRADISPEREQLERVIESPDFLPAEFMVAGGSRQACVGRIAFKATYQHPQGGTFYPDEGWGTGFLVSPSLLLTNNHVLENRDFAAAKVKVQFNYQRRLADDTIGDSDSYDFDAHQFFYTNAALDFTLVRVKGKPASATASGALQLPGTRWGQYHLADSAGISDASYFERMSLNIIQHPAGRPKEVAIHNNFFDQLLPNHIRYTTDTEGGSSGSPVFDNRWLLFALHHSAGDANPDGTWKNNQGVRIDKIIRHIVESADIPAAIKTELGL